MADNLLKKKQQRNGYRLNANKQIQAAIDLVSDQQPILQRCKLTFSLLRDYREKLSVLDNEILELIDPDNAETETNTAIATDQNIMEAMAQLEMVIDGLVRPTQASATTSRSSAGQSHSQSVPNVRLPTLDMPIFSGDYTEWHGFFDCFVSTVDANPTLNDVDKFKYLKRYLSGEALTLAEGYNLEGRFYKEVLDALQKRYGKTQRAVFAHIDALYNLPACTDHDTAKLQQVFDTCEKHVRCLGALGLSEDQFGVVFIPLILAKLPKYVRYEVSRKVGSEEDWTFPKLRRLLGEEIAARDFCENIPDSNTNARYKRNDQNRKANGATVSALITNDSKLHCRFCGEDHYSDQCAKYSTVEERRAKVKSACFRCLKTGHIASRCYSKKRCVHCGSTGHNRAICEKKFPKGISKSGEALINEAKAESTDSDPSVVKGTNLISLGQTALLQTAKAEVVGSKSQKANMRLLLDTACTRTCITEKRAKQIGLAPIREEIISVAGFQDEKRRTSKFKVVEFDVTLRNGGALRVTANVVPVISCPIQRVPINLQKFPVLRELQLAEQLCVQPEMVEIDILVGNDYYYDIVEQERISCGDGFHLLRSKLGYIPTGRLSDSSDQMDHTCMYCPIAVESVLSGSFEPNLERLWSQEEIGVRESQTSHEDDEAVRIFNETVRVDESGRYEVTLPWRTDKSGLPDNYGLALGCLKSQGAKFRDKPAIVSKYNDTIQEQLRLDIIEQAPLKPDGEIVHYLPHHAVIRPDRATTKLRIVHNASAKSKKDKPSLNECLYRGPVILEDLGGMLIRFRVNKIALTSDIEKAFLQVGIQVPDRDVARFLWVRNVNEPFSPTNLVTYRFTRVFFGCIASSFLLEGTIVTHLTRNSNLPVAHEILKNHYVDNVHGGRDTAAEANEFYRSAKALFSSARMNLREWFTNEPDVLSSIPEWDRGAGNETKVLGLTWSIVDDTLCCSKTMKAATEVFTKRQILKELATVYDPLGFFCPILLPIKIMMQDLWIQGHKWDEQLPTSIVSKYAALKVECCRISEIKLPRYFGIPANSEIELHCFCDASKKAYAAVVYIVFNGNSSLVVAKSRVSPIKREMTIPRLELMAMLIGSRILQFVSREIRMSVGSKYLWTDSQCVLAWLTSPQVLTPFVENRVREIRSSSDMQWKYVPTHENPADVASRGTTFETLQHSTLWWAGPEWIRQSRNQWPEWEVPRKDVIDECSPIEASVLPVLNSKPNEFCLELLGRYSSLPKLVRVVSWMRRFASNARQPVPKLRNLTKGMSAAEFREGLRVLIKLDQAYHKVGQTHGSDIAKNVIRQLKIFRDKQGLHRCQGRFQHSDMPYNAKFPIFLPRCSWLSRLIVRHAHGQALHAGVPETLAKLRSEYWIPHGPTTVRKVVDDCRTCRKWEGGHFKCPDPPPLPQFRVCRSRPFDAVGVDHLGPLFVRQGISDSKVWLILFTCAAVRAIHLEVVEDLTASQVLMAVQRLVARFGTPSIIVSDNASNYKACDRFLTKAFKEALNSDSVQRYSSERGINRSFIVQRAPWMGGFYERLVGSVKRALRKALQNRKLNLVELQTIAAEVSACVNTRPLVLVKECGEQSLCPQNFLTGETQQLLPAEPVEVDEFINVQSDKTSLKRSWNRIQAIANMFWKAWYGMYLPSLRPKKSNVKQRGASKLSPSVGGIVQVQDENLKRGQWRLGRILKLNNSNDSRVRSAVVLSKGKHLTRSLKHLFPIECESDDDEIGKDDEQVNGTDPGMGQSNDGIDRASSGMDRPKRVAAKKASQAVRHILEADNSDSDDS